MKNPYKSYYPYHVYNRYNKRFLNQYQIPKTTSTPVVLSPGLIGSWLDALGTVVAAIGSTPSKVIPATILEDFVFIGNSLQGIGSALVVESPETLENDRVGSAIQSIGNLTVLIALLQDEGRPSRRLNKQGNLLQALGGGVSFNYDGEITSINNIGNGLQVLGNSLQALSLKESLFDTEEGELMDVAGSWIQAVGTIISALSYEGAERGG